MLETFVGLALGLGVLCGLLSMVLGHLEAIVIHEQPSRITRITIPIRKLAKSGSFNVPNTRVGLGVRWDPWLIWVKGPQDIFYFNVTTERFPLFGQALNLRGRTLLQIRAQYSEVLRVFSLVMFALAVSVALYLGDGAIAGSIVLLPSLALFSWFLRSHLRRTKAINEMFRPVVDAMEKGNLIPDSERIAAIRARMHGVLGK